MRFLLAGWFSFENAHATAGDLLVCDVVRRWLVAAGYQCDVALAPPFQGGVDLNAVEPRHYSHLLFVCGPFMPREWEAQVLGRFADCIVVGVNLTLPVPLDIWNPFDLLLERDSSRSARPDLAFVSPAKRVPLVGVCLVEWYEGGLVEAANAAIDQLLAANEMAAIRIDTRLDTNETGFKTPAEIESVLSRMDLVITTRLHGTVLALKHGVPAVAIDTVPGGGKVRRQAETIGWPIVLSADALDQSSLQRALDYCLTESARVQAGECRARAVGLLDTVASAFVPLVTSLLPGDSKRSERRDFALTHGWRPR